MRCLALLCLCTALPVPSQGSLTGVINLCTALPVPAQGSLTGFINYLGCEKHAATLDKFVPMADTIHKVGESMYVHMHQLMFGYYVLMFFATCHMFFAAWRFLDEVIQKRALR